MRIFLLVLISFVAIAAVCSGLLMMYEPDGHLLNLSPELLKTSPFRNYFVPGLMLSFVVGGAHFFASVITNRKNPQSYRYSLVAGFVLAAWIIIQTFFLPSYHWLQIAFLVVAIFIILLSYQLMGKAVF